MHILVIEDDLEAAGWLVKGLREAGHVTDHAGDGEEGLAMAREGDYDVLIVDRMMPKMDGLTLVRKLREEGDMTPALFLSALGDVDDKVEGLRAGGDDYIAKPYAFSELLARVEVLGRRKTAEPVQTRLKVGDLEMDLLKRKVTGPARRSCSSRASSSCWNT